MTKQDEIREGMAAQCYANAIMVMFDQKVPLEPRDWDELLIDQKEFYRKQADDILQYLHSKGVVIKVDGKLDLEDEASAARIWPSIFDGSLPPSQYYYEMERYLAFIKLIQEEIKEAGFEAVEPLIKEVMPSDESQMA